METIDVSKENFKEFKDKFDSWKTIDLSESDTRSKVLDQILINILGWDENDIKREEYSDNGKYDYKVSTAIFQFIVEAKRNFKDLILPDTGGNKFKIKTLMNKGNTKVIEQIRLYLVDHGLAYGVISNGYQFVVAKFVNNDGTDWKNNDCYIFRNLNEIENDFITFFNLFSKEAVLKNGRIKFFQEIPKGKTVLEIKNPYNKDEEIVRNELSSILIQIVSEVFESISDLEDNTLLKECYVENKDVKKQNSELDMLFPDNPPNFDDKIERLRNTANTRDKIKEKIVNDSVSNPIIIIGSKGAGKTTFIKYFVEITLQEDRRSKKVPVIYLDFKNHTYSQIKNTEAIYKDIIDKVESKYLQYDLTSIETLKKIYNAEIEKNLKGIWNFLKDSKDGLEQKISEFLEIQLNEKINHLKKVSQYLYTYYGVRMCVVLDNADQLDDDSQKEVFLLSQSIKDAIRSLVILSLREGYYFQWKNHSPFDAYPSVVYHVTAPPYGEILKKRIKYVLKNYNFNKIRANYRGNIKVILKDEQIKKFFETLENTFFSEINNDEVLKFLGETSYPNIRSLLEKVRLFLLSGYTKISTYIAMEFDRIPIWDFIKTISLESRYYYKSRLSIIFNLFYPVQGNTNHFTKIRILKYLYYRLTIDKNENFEDYKTISSLFYKIGYGSEILIKELNELLKYGLIETPNSSSDTINLKIDENSKFKVTLSGKYYICNLLYRSIYIDLVAQDTPIYDENALNEIVSKFPISQRDTGNRDMKNRVEVIEKFINYLDKQEKIELNNFSQDDELKAIDFSIVELIKNNERFNKDMGLMKRNI